MSCDNAAPMGLKATVRLEEVPQQAYSSDELWGAPESCDNDAPMGLEATASIEEVPQWATGL